ncbi:MAG: hypothetical protein KZQ60_03785, partial [Candidatus Thiodiazotropha sp. (ex Lucinoma aequizonata)]|nr:hypothetical protein [Candidatus Thiodiazotropha sp. (ex Lucinoma aequizonata)]MCU7895378.1 hypothetical protein [Candidatus Thiodiazotropha sp. (ex Lucinoma aequizonata)]MCU7912701.1 hypothetical protein [Candidatus Thiodiazotropha sp. (ex Lucinoma aequizonata)]
KGKSDRKPGGQKWHNGTTLEPVDDPDEVTELKIDRRTLPKGPQYKKVGHEIRQIIDIDILRFVTEYWAEILEDNQGNQFQASLRSRERFLDIPVHQNRLDLFDSLFCPDRPAYVTIPYCTSTASCSCTTPS